MNLSSAEEKIVRLDEVVRHVFGHLKIENGINAASCVVAKAVY